MSYFLKTEVKSIRVNNNLSLYQRCQSMQYRAIRFPGTEQASILSAAIDTRFGNDPSVISSLAGASFDQRGDRLAAQPFADYGQPCFSVARWEAAYGINPFPAGLNEGG